MRRSRFLTILFLSLLLVGYQQAGLVHPITHVAERLTASADVRIAADIADETCLECALLTGGAYGPAASTPTLPSAPSADGRLARSVPGPAAAGLAAYLSRAPPPLPG